jgi:hypothetical protein
MTTRAGIGVAACCDPVSAVSVRHMPVMLLGAGWRSSDETPPSLENAAS